MSALYERITATAQRQIADKGAAWPVRRIAKSAADPDKPWNLTETPVTGTMVGVKIDDLRSLGFARDAIEKSDVGMIVAAGGDWVPTIGDEVDLGDRTPTILDMKTIAPSGAPIVWMLHLR